MYCPQCRFFQAVPKREDVGECRRMPPQLIIISFQIRAQVLPKLNVATHRIVSGDEALTGATAWQSMFPLVALTWNCGEFTPKIEQ